jgi:hypothetical protein
VSDLLEGLKLAAEEGGSLGPAEVRQDAGGVGDADLELGERRASDLVHLVLGQVNAYCVAGVDDEFLDEDVRVLRTRSGSDSLSAMLSRNLRISSCRVSGACS